jgi:steroid delta-isomerase-like uncharacterized protein
MTLSESLRTHRQNLVLEHIDAESARDVETAVRTFTRPRYDLRAIEGGVIEGEDAVRGLIQGMTASMPSVTYVAEQIHHADDAVIVEYRITGRHDGAYAGIPATGATIDHPAVAIYEFDGPDLVEERLYLNLRSLEAQMRGESGG